ncbi:MAG: uridine diphosphate-N-acetylglucosamine-binding protein YvcK [Atopostipes suicloacalis]|nr:uridine diphosphate-N-acetylglucosamine-binding protein YvcK [Atopostipes suicloacalis]
MKIYRPKRKRPKITVIGGGTGLPVLLKSLRNKNVDITAIVTVADDGGSSGLLRKMFNTVPPGDLRNVLISLSDIPRQQRDIFQYRFKSDDKSLDGHSLGNLIILATSEMHGSIYQAVQLLAKMMHVNGNIYPASEEPLNLHARYKDGSYATGESKIAHPDKIIDYVTVSTTNKEDTSLKPGKKVISSIMESDMIVLGPGSLYTSILPSLMIPKVRDAMIETEAEIIYISNIMTQMGETEGFTDAKHIEVLSQHLGANFVDTVLVNNAEVPKSHVAKISNDEYLYQVVHDFKQLQKLVPSVISNDFLNITEKGVYHNGDLVVEEILRAASYYNLD